MADQDKNITPPYASYKSFTNFVKGLRENGCPSHITRSIIPGSNSGKAMMAATLRYLDLVNDKEEPTEKLKQLINSDANYSEELKKILTDSYGFLNDHTIDLRHTTTDKVAEKFRELGASGSTVSKCMAFFLAAAKDAKIQVSQYVKAPAPVRANAPRKSKNRGRSNDEDRSSDDLPPPPPPPPPSRSTWQEQLLSKFPEFDPSWDDETRKKWFDAFQELMSKGGN